MSDTPSKRTIPVTPEFLTWLRAEGSPEVASVIEELGIKQIQGGSCGNTSRSKLSFAEDLKKLVPESDPRMEYFDREPTDRTQTWLCKVLDGSIPEEFFVKA